MTNWWEIVCSNCIAKEFSCSFRLMGFSKDRLIVFLLNFETLNDCILWDALVDSISSAHLTTVRLCSILEPTSSWNSPIHLKNQLTRTNKFLPYLNGCYFIYYLKFNKLYFFLFYHISFFYYLCDFNMMMLQPNIVEYLRNALRYVFCE